MGDNQIFSLRVPTFTVSTMALFKGLLCWPRGAPRQTIKPGSSEIPTLSKDSEKRSPASDLKQPRCKLQKKNPNSQPPSYVPDCRASHRNAGSWVNHSRGERVNFIDEEDRRPLLAR